MSHKPFDLPQRILTQNARAIRNLNRFRGRHRSRLRRFAYNDSGIATLEFALFLPVLLALLLGGVSVFDITRANSRVDSAAAAIVDLATRLNEINASRINDFGVAANSIVSFYADEPVSFSVSSVINSANEPGNRMTVVWSEARGNSPKLTDADLAALGLPQLPDGASFIVIQTQIDYVPLFDLEFLPEKVTLKGYGFRTPRFARQICFDRAAATAVDDLVCG